MSISTSAAALPLPVPAEAAIEALAQRSGQVIEARVANSGPGGSPQIVIANQSIDISAALKLQEGALIRLLVQGGGANTRLTVLPAPASPQASPPPTGQPASAPASTTAPRHAPPPSPGQPVQAGTQTAESPPVSSARPAPVPLPAGTGRSLPLPVQPPATGPNAAPAQPVPVTASGGGLPPQVQPPVLSFQSGTVPLPSAAPNIASAPQPGAPATLEPGTVLRIDREVSGARARPILVPVTNPKAPETARQQGSVSPLAAQGTTPTPLQQAVQQTVQGAVARQDSITTLLSTLAGLGAKLASLPKPVSQAGSELLAAQVQVDGKPLDGQALKQAFNRSGILYESSLLKSTGQAPPKGDIKAGLLNLRGALKNWLGPDAEPKLPASNRPPPPTPGAQPRTERPAPPQAQALPPNTETGTWLLGQTDAALARTRLTQISSLPDGMMRAGQVSNGPAELNIELPLMFGGEMSVGQFQILRDGAHDAEIEGDGEWKMRFSIHFTQTGEVGATVSLRGGKTHVMLWAEREETAEALDTALGELESALDARGLSPGTLKCRMGHPPQAKKPVGAFMDNCS